jgi:AcrR family transcriptional regulator
VSDTTRVERKERTRRAILDAALRLSGEQTLAVLSLRQVAKEVGVVPTAFYRHFASLDELGLALVEESFASLRAMLRDVRQGAPAFNWIIDNSIDVVVEHVHAQRAHFGFIARERGAGPRVVREEIRHQVELFERELATDLARLPGTDTWAQEDLQVLANLIVTQMVAFGEQITTARGRAEEQIVRRARRQLRMVLIGAMNWRSGESADDPGRAGPTGVSGA